MNIYEKECSRYQNLAKARGSPCLLCPLKLLQKLVTKKSLSPGAHVSTIASKTGTSKYAGSKSRVVAEICDAQGTCCQTSSDGRGLDNSKVVRQAGQTDVYTDTAILGSCSQKVVYILTLGEEKLLGLDVLIYLCFDQLCLCY